MATEPTVNDMMEAYALDAVDAAQDTFGVTLDYSVESVKSLDEILQRFHDQLPKGVRKAFRRGPSEEQIAGWSKIWGGYLGEVIRRKWGGSWDIDADTNAICLRVGTTTMWPPSRAHKRMLDGPEEGVYDYVKVFEHAHSADAGAVGPDIANPS